MERKSNNFPLIFPLLNFPQPFEKFERDLKIPFNRERWQSRAHPTNFPSISTNKSERMMNMSKKPLKDLNNLKFLLLFPTKVFF